MGRRGLHGSAGCAEARTPRRHSIGKEREMKQIECSAVGRPEDVVECVDAAMPPKPDADDVLVKVLAFPINPADLLTMQGVYPRLDASTRAIGNEAVGEIVAIGADVERLAPRDRVILLTLNNWREFRLVKAHDVITLVTFKLTDDRARAP